VAAGDPAYAVPTAHFYKTRSHDGFPFSLTVYEKESAPVKIIRKLEYYNN
jgi:hypothetical protein